MWQRARLTDDAILLSDYVWPDPPFIWVLCKLLVYMGQIAMLTNCQDELGRALVVRVGSLSMMEEQREDLYERDVIVLQQWPLEANA